MRLKIGLFLLLMGLANLAKAAVLEAIRYNRQEGKMQLVLDMSAQTAFQHFELGTPPRIVLDLPDTQHKNLDNLNLNIGAVIGVRVGYKTPEILRVVIDLNDNAKNNVYVLPPEAGKKDRIVVDIFDTGKKASTQTASNAPQTSKPATTPPAPSLSLTSLDEPTTPAPITNASPPKAVIQTPTVSTSTTPAKAQTTTASTASVSNHTSSKTPEKTSVATVSKRAPIRKRDIVVCIDPGHGGKDPGASNKATGALEKNVVLAIGKRLRTKLLARKGYKVVMTRDSDIFIPLHQRPQKCRKAGGDLFVSIHADAVENTVAKGSSVYILSTRGASSQLAKYLEKSENSVDIKWGVDVSRYDDDIQSALFNIQQEATLESSNVLARETLAELAKVGNVHKKNVERANFAVLRSPEIPSMLVETAFISNPSEAKLLMKASYQEQLATGIANGIERFFNEHLPKHMIAN